MLQCLAFTYQIFENLLRFDPDFCLQNFASIILTNLLCRYLRFPATETFYPTYRPSNIGHTDYFLKVFASNRSSWRLLTCVLVARSETDLHSIEIPQWGTWKKSNSQSICYKGYNIWHIWFKNVTFWAEQSRRKTCILPSGQYMSLSVQRGN